MNSAEDRTSQIAGYHLIEQLYCGSRTVVYRAIRETDQHPVAIKLLQRDYPSFNELLQFRNQYTIAKNLCLPGIVEPYSLEPYRNSYALVMEDFGGISLKEYTKNHDLELEEFLAIALQLTDILHHLSQHRVIHKDLKPANILINPETKQIKLIDFSIASLLPKETQEIKNPNGLEGTLAYLAPEQTGRMNRGIDYRSDFYALGITLFELLSGQLPFQSNDPMELVHCHIAKVPPTLLDLNPTLPSVLSEIVSKLMAKNAEDRYQSALGLQYDLERCCSLLQATGTIEAFEIGKQDICDRFLIPEKLYGRETEVQTLLTAFERVAQGSSELMLVAGFSGIGKTAVVNEVHKPIVRQRGYFIKGKFDQFNRNIPFSAFVQAFRDLMGQFLSESDIQLQQWKSKILEVLGDDGQVIIDVIPELERIIGQQPLVPELSGTAAQNRFNLLFAKFISVFTTKEHPLVIFLDDLQWADSASLKLIQLLMGELHSGYLLMIGAYRDNEVSPGHPLILTLNEVSKLGATFNTITLAPLPLTSLSYLVADTLSCSPQLAQPLTDLIYQKTQGNPFFTTQFLKALHQDNLITFNRPVGHWECDITQVRKAALTDSVVEFMAQQLQKLPRETQEILKLAACIGNQFDLATLAITSQKSEIESATALWKALQEGLIMPQSEVYKFYLGTEQSIPQDTSYTVAYRFLHDRVQQAAYSLIPDEQKEVTHLTIGRLLLQNTAEAEHLFEIINHLNRSASLITDVLEQRSLIQLNLKGCHRAKAATAYAAALSYAIQAINLLPPEPWQTDYNLTLNLYESAAEAAYLNTEFERAEELIHTVWQYSEHPIDCLKSYELLVQIYIAKDLQLKAIETGLEALTKLGIPFVERVNWQENLPPIPEEKSLLTKESMSNAAYLAALQILMRITPPVHHVKPELYPAITLTMVELCDRAGYSGLAAYVYGNYGVLLGALLQDLESAHRCGKVSLALLERYQAREVQAKVNMLFAVFLGAIKEPGHLTLPVLKQGIQAGLETGDIEHVSYCIMAYFSHFFLLGQPLDLIEQVQRDYLPLLEQFKQEHCIEYSKVWLHVTDELTISGLSSVPARDLEILKHFETTHNHQCLFAFHLAKLIFCYTLGNYDQAKDHAVQALKNQEAAFGILLTTAFNFYYSLALLASVNSQQQQEIFEQVAINQAQLKKLSEQAPSNYLHKFQLVAAELCRCLGEKTEAMDYYDQAIAVAKENRYFQEEALANELAAKFYLEWGKEKVAQAYMQEAYYCYARWGAKAKVDDLEKRYPQLLQPILNQPQLSFNLLETLATITHPSIVPSTQASSSSSSSFSNVLDFASILQAAQAISSTIELGELISTLTQIILRNSGAETCVLLLPKKGQWQIRAIAQIQPDDQPPKILLQAQPLEGSQIVPVKLIRYVQRTLEPLIIEEGNTDIPSLTGEPLLPHQPQSVLCTPILNQGNLVAMLYLEHHSTKGVFTSDRIVILSFLCSQAAISLKNAQLYTDLQASNARFQKLADNIPGVIYRIRIDADGSSFMPYISSGCINLCEVSPEKIMSGEQSLRSLEHPDDIPEIKQAILESAQHLTPFHHQWRIVTPSGKVKWVQAASQPERQDDGSLIWDGVLLDITERKQAETAVQQKSQELEQTLQHLQQAQLQIIQSEKMSALGNLVAGVAHEINNPVGFLNGNIQPALDYIHDLLRLLDLYQEKYPHPDAEIVAEMAAIELEYLREDLPQLIGSMHEGVKRIKDISTSLRTFSRADNKGKQLFNLHEGLDSALLILKHRLKANETRPAIEVMKEYGNLPTVECFPGQLNQVFMNILANAIDALEEANRGRSFKEIQSNPNCITIHSQIKDHQWVIISITDNGIGMTQEVQQRIFDHLFTTKAVGQGTGLGLAIARQIVTEKHNGKLWCHSTPGQGTQFVIEIPLRQNP